MEVFESIDVEAQSIHKLLPRICKEKLKKKKKKRTKEKSSPVREELPKKTNKNYLN
jgi:hypothetical protein